MISHLLTINYFNTFFIDRHYNEKILLEVKILYFGRANTMLPPYCFLQMRDLVNRRSFLLRKKVDNFLFWLLPNIWVPLYLSVAFTNIGYRQCMDNKHWQDKVCLYIFLSKLFCADNMDTLYTREGLNYVPDSFFVIRVSH